MDGCAPNKTSQDRNILCERASSDQIIKFGVWKLGTMSQPPIAWMQSASDHGRLEAFGELTATFKRLCTFQAAPCIEGNVPSLARDHPTALKSNH